MAFTFPRSNSIRIRLRTLLGSGIVGLVLLAALAVFFVGFGTARESTLRLLSAQAEAIVGSMIAGFERVLDPVTDQAAWIEQEVRTGRLDLHDEPTLDAFVRGAFAATPDLWVIGFVEGVGDGVARIYERPQQDVLVVSAKDDSALRRLIREYERGNIPSWGRPTWIDSVGFAVISFYTPLQSPDGDAMLLIQAVKISQLSETLVGSSDDPIMMPFVLYDGEYILAHPLLLSLKTDGTSESPLESIDDFSDASLLDFYAARDVTPDFLGVSDNVSVTNVDKDDDQIIFISEDVEGLANRPLTFGAYFRTSAVEDSDITRVVRSGAVAIVVVVVSAVAALILGRLLGHPITRLTSAMSTLNRGYIDDAPTLGSSPIREIDTASTAFNTMVAGLRERRLMQDILGTYVPERLVSEMLQTGGALEPVSTRATVLFVDLAGFTAIAEGLPPAEIVEMLNEYFSVAAHIIERRNGVITQFQGDAILAVFNVPIPDSNHAENAVETAIDLAAAVERETFAGQKLRIRVGITTGDLVAGSVGASDRRSYTVHGDVVNLAARLEQMNKQTETTILMDEETVRSAPSRAFTEIDTAVVRGKSNAVTIYTLSPSLE